MNMNWPADKVERRATAALIPYAKNARTHSEAQVDEIAASMREWGFTIPVLVDEDGEIIAGHGRIRAAAKLGFETVPAMVAEGWSDEQKRAYRLADNKIALNAGWDVDMLVAELAGLPGMESLIGFSEQELLELAGGGKQGLTDPDEVPLLPEEPISLPGDLWHLGQHRLLCGDATSSEDVDRLLDGVVPRPNLMVTDPPYGVNYDPAWRMRVELNKGNAIGKVKNDHRADWRAAWSLFTGNVAYVWHGGLHAGEVAESLAATGFVVRAQIIWNKNRMVIGRGDYHWQHEPCWYVVRKGEKGSWAGGRKQTTIWDIQHMKNDTGHGTQKPVECMRRPIVNNSKLGESIYEPFNGSGTTIIAAEMTKRACCAVEIDPAYVDLAVERWQAFTGEAATLDSDGRAFAAVSETRKNGPAKGAVIKAGDASVRQ